jgi:hypothetical protein
MVNIVADLPASGVEGYRVNRAFNASLEIKALQRFALSQQQMALSDET